MEKLMIQIGLKQGRNADLYRLSDREVYVGRAYHNDIVLTDPYVAPEQLRIYCSDPEHQHWHINVLDTTNPVLINGEALDTGTAPIRPGDAITVGRTQLRLYSDAQVVEPTRKLLVSSWLHKAASSLAIPVLLFLAVSLVEGASDFWLSNTDGDWQTHALNMVTGMTVLLFWAGGWAVVGRLLRHQPHFTHQLLITSLAAAVGTLLIPIEVYAEFLSDSTQLRTLLTYTLGAALLAVLLHFNLFFATNIKHTAWIAAGFSVGITALAYLYVVSEEEGLDHHPQYSQALLPPAMNPRAATTLDNYLSAMDSETEQASALARAAPSH